MNNVFSGRDHLRETRARSSKFTHEKKSFQWEKTVLRTWREKMSEVFLTRKKSFSGFVQKTFQRLLFYFIVHSQKSSRLIVSLSWLVTTYRWFIAVGHILSLAHRHWNSWDTNQTVLTVKQQISQVGSDVATFLPFPESNARETCESKYHFVAIRVLFRRNQLLTWQKKRIGFVFVFGRSKNNTTYWNNNIQSHFFWGGKEYHCIAHNYVLPLKIEFVTAERKKATISKSVL